MSRRALLLIAALAVLPTHAADRDFDLIVSRLQTQSGKSPMGTGFLGFMARCFSPKGVSGLKMAIFEDIDTKRMPLGNDFDAFVGQTVGAGREPMVRIRSKNGERVYVFMEPKGSKAELLMVTADGQDAVVMKMKIDPKRMQEWMANPEGMARQKEKHEG